MIHNNNNCLYKAKCNNLATLLGAVSREIRLSAEIRLSGMMMFLV